jgi:hypothetical protein
MCKYFITLLLFFSASALAIDTFDETTNILTIDSVVLEGIQYNNVVVRLNAFDVISVGSSAPVDDGTVAETCTDANFTLARYDAIIEGMTLDQVNQIIGCKSNVNVTLVTEVYVHRIWHNGGQTVGNIKGIGVYFDSTTGNIVKAKPSVPSIFKVRVGFL